jgi:hypothetical protein
VLIDVIYSASRVISLVYLFDAVVEGLLIAGWVRFLVARQQASALAAGPELPPTPQQGAEG